MRTYILLVGIAAFASFGLVEKCFAQAEAVEKEKQAEETIVGLWHADSVALISTSGARKKLPTSEQNPFNIKISDKNIVMRVGEQQFADMTYSLDASQTPAAIDMKFQDQEMLGIYELKGNELKICLNDSKKQRPKTFGKEDSDMDLVLRRFTNLPLMKINADGSNVIKFTSLDEYSFGTSDWTSDGKKISVDTWHSFVGKDWQQSHVYVMNADGSSPKDLGDGTLPSWSPDGKQIAFSRYNPRGIWTMNADGSDKTMIDPNGWSADWSPKKNELAYSISGNICVMDLKTKDRRYLLEKAYRSIYWGLVWSPDAQWICYYGTLPDGSNEVAIVNSQSQSKGFKVLLPNEAIKGVKAFQTCFSWSPDGKQIALSMTMEGDKKKQIYILDVEGNKQPRRLADQNPNTKNYTPAWSPDGKEILYGREKGE